MRIVNFCNKVIEYAFYALFFLVPLVFAGNTSELFEFNKMWLTFGLTVIIMTAWLTKMTGEKRVFIQKTPLDIPIMLFLLSQIISTIFSLDQFVSWWGYYSRWNGGLLSLICYILLYYAFVSNLSFKQTMRTLLVSLLTGTAVSVWGFPSHFGADPTCLVFRGTFDTTCWTYQFQPTVRAFSTLGQPAWLAAYLALLTPLSMAYALKQLKLNAQFWLLFTLSIFFYLVLIFANTRAGFLAFGIADVVLWVVVFIKKLLPVKFYLRALLLFHVAFFVCNFFFGFPLESLAKLSFSSIKDHLAAKPAAQQQSPTASAKKTPDQTSDAYDTTITDSGQIRLLVWQGALDAWRNSPIFGTGVETFAFAYYKYRPAAHNMTSEWDYLYNKAHNEYLNYLTTTGIFGLGSYVAMIILFLWFVLTKYAKKREAHAKENSQSFHEAQNLKTKKTHIVTIGLMSGYISILISNGLGFSVVIINLYLFLIPAMVFILNDMLNPEKTFVFLEETKKEHKITTYINPYQWTGIGLYVLLALWLISGLIRYWQADVAYALGANLDRVNQYQRAYPLLTKAVDMIGDEPVYKDELSVNLATLATALYSQKDTTNGDSFTNQAIAYSDDVTTNHPNDIVYWKNRVRIFYTLAEGGTKNQQKYFPQALQAIMKAATLAPTDAKVSYNLGVLLGQNGNIDKAITVLNNTIKLKPDYRDAYFALGLFYRVKAVDANNKVVNTDMEQKAVATYQYILKHLSPGDKQVKDSLKSWGA